MSDYAEVPYESLPIPDSHPERLAALGYLFGLSPADPASCRVLELGCASGGNLVPLAFYFPGSRYLGIDLYANQIAAGQSLIDAVGLENIALRQGDILDLDGASLGRFDYVIVHGVYSWVPDAVRERILGLCAAVLEPQGIAYVSYNTLPGWRMRGMLRDILGYAARGSGAARDQLTAIGGCLDRMERALAGLGAASARYLTSEIGRLRARPGSYLVHEFLEAENRPLLFADFLAAATDSGLRYVCDTDLQTRYPEVVGDAVARALADLGTAIEREQYLDFVVNRNFRRSLLCRADARPAAEPLLGRVEDMQFAADLAPPRKLDLRRARPAPFTRSDHTTVEAHHPLTKAALVHLGQHYPDSLSPAALAALASREVAAAGGGSLANESGNLVSELYSLAVLGAAEMLHRRRATHRPAEGRLVPTRLARAQLGGADHRLVTRQHTLLAVDEFGTRLLEHLDGRRDVGEVLDCVIEDVAEGRLILDGVTARGVPEARGRELLRRNVERLVETFLRAGILVQAT